MITAHDVDRLRAWRSHEYPMVSLYLNVTPPRPFVSELNSLIHLQKERWATRAPTGEDTAVGNLCQP
jgi:hypothetical protein